LVVGHVCWDAFKRRRTWYTLTDRRALIASDLPLQGRRLKSYAITAETTVELRPGTTPSIYFAKAQRRSRNGTGSEHIGFERIAEGDRVYRLIRDVQQGAR